MADLLVQDLKVWTLWVVSFLQLEFEPWLKKCVLISFFDDIVSQDLGWRRPVSLPLLWLK